MVSQCVPYFRKPHLEAKDHHCCLAQQVRKTDEDEACLKLWVPDHEFYNICLRTSFTQPPTPPHKKFHTAFKPFAFPFLSYGLKMEDPPQTIFYRKDNGKESCNPSAGSGWAILWPWLFVFMRTDRHTCMCKRLFVKYCWSSLWFSSSVTELYGTS